MGGAALLCAPSSFDSRRRTPLPTYVYRCQQCGQVIERRQSFTDAALTECESCSGQLQRVLQPVGIIFKGSGFYSTDYRPGGKAGNGADETSKSEDSAKSERTGSSDTKSSSSPSTSSKPSDTKSSSTSGSSAPASSPSSGSSSSS
jgi:putative FmdB family regulatory protein